MVADRVGTNDMWLPFRVAGALLLAAAAIVLVGAFVRLHEEPALRRRYGAQYVAYCAAVPGWWPRLRRR